MPSAPIPPNFRPRLKRLQFCWIYLSSDGRIKIDERRERRRSEIEEVSQTWDEAVRQFLSFILLAHLHFISISFSNLLAPLLAFLAVQS